MAWYGYPINSNVTKKCMVLLVATALISCSLLFVILTNIKSNKLQSQNENLAPNASISLCVLVRVYYRQISYLPVFALALSQSGFPNIRLYIINTGKNTDSQLLLDTINLINSIVRRADYAVLLDVGTPVDNDFGYTLTDRALVYLYEQYEKSPSICKYIVLTNGDNLYSQYLGKHALPHMHAKKDIIAWDFVSRFYRDDPNRKSRVKTVISPEIVDNGTDKCVPVELRVGEVDLGAVAYRLEFLKKHKIQIHYDKGNYDGLSDGYLVEKVARLTNASVILRQTLFIHQ